MGAAPYILPESWSGETFNPPLPLDINTIEAAIVARLKLAVGNVVAVEHFPDKQIMHYRLTHQIGAVLVIYEGADYGEIDNTEFVAQIRTMRFGVGVVIRDLGWAYGGPPSGTSPGAYQVIEAIRQSLTGFRPNEGCDKMYPLREDFSEIDKEGGTFTYATTYATKTLAVENYVAPNFPLLVKVTAQEEGGQTTVAVPAAPMTFNGSDQIVLPYPNVSAVTVSSLSGQVYLLGIDYSLDSVNGIITRLGTGGIAAGATVNIAYSHSEIVTTIAGGGTAPTQPTN